MPTSDRVRVPRLLSRERSMWLSLAAAVVGAGAVLAWVGATQPDNRPFVAAAAAVLVLAVLAVLGQRTWIDLGRGEVVRETFFVRRRAVAWADAERVALTGNRGGQVLLEVRGRGTSIFLPIAADDLGGARSQDPDLLRLLAAQIETWAPERTAVVSGLRARATPHSTNDSSDAPPGGAPR